MKKLSVIIFLTIMIGSVTVLLTQCHTVTDADIDAAKSNWEEGMPENLVSEIKTAFTEIGEDPDKIVNVTYVDTHTSGHVFERKCYKVEFYWSFGHPGYKHSKEYRIVTQNYFDGEPEKAEHPEEYLVKILFWEGDDGHGTNINQWTDTGYGELQKDGND